MKNREIDIQNRVAKHYKEIRYKKPYSRYYHCWWISKMISMVKNKGLVLDNGCGIGFLFEYLKSNSCKKDFKVIGLDISEKMISEAKKKDHNVVLGDSQKLPFNNGYFNIVFARSLLHHLPNPELGLQEIARVLCSGGEIIISDTNKSLLSSMPRKIAQKGKSFSDDHKNFNSKQLIGLIKNYFKIERIYYFGYLAYPLVGFPDIFDFFKYIPLKMLFVKGLVLIDQIFSLIPVIKKQSWGIIIKGRKN